MDTYTIKALGQTPNERLRQFAALLQSENQKCNLTRITETGQIYLRHFADSLRLTGLLDRRVSGTSSSPSRFQLIDMGSGPGLPGLALAMARPAWEVTSVEATGKKVSFQRLVKAATDLSNAQIMQARAEDLGHDPAYRGRFDVVTARAVAHLRILAELGLPLARLGGTLAFFKGPKVDQELREARASIEHLGAKIVDGLAYCLSELAQDLEPVPDIGDGTLSIILMEKVAPTPPDFPRPFSLIKQKPLQA